MVRSCERIALALLVTTCALAALVPPAAAAEGRIPLWTQVALGPGSTPGKYIVTRDISAVPGSGLPAISISGGPGFEEVDIDLNGFTVYGDPFGGAAVISASGMNSVTIRNGGVRHFGPVGNVIEIFASAKAIVEDVKVTDGFSGILLSDVPSFAVRRNVVVTSGSNGIVIFGPPPFAGAPSASGVIEGNQVRAAAVDGIGVFSMISSITIRNNQIELPGGSGIAVSGPAGPGAIVGSLIVAENTVQEAALTGILIRQVRKGKVYNNTVYSSGADGIALIPTTGFLVLDNVSGGNGANGLVVEGAQNHIDRNVLTGNGAAGLWFGFGSMDNTYGRNTARANGVPTGPCAFAPIAVCPFPLGPAGTFPPDFCNDGPGNTSFCDNLMPGPPQG